MIQLTDGWLQPIYNHLNIREFVDFATSSHFYLKLLRFTGKSGNRDGTVV